MHATTSSAHGQMPSFLEARPLGAGDEAFLKDIRAVFSKHGNMGRFGLCLLHEHFEMGSDEVLLETHDKQSRTLTMVPVKNDSGMVAKETSWHLMSEDGPVALTKCAEDKCK